MAVEVTPLNILGGTVAPVTSFSDPMSTAAVRNILSPPSDSWLYIPVSGDTPTAVATIPQFLFGQALSGGGLGLGSSSVAFGGAPTYVLATAITPQVLYIGSPYYIAKQKFVQLTFNAFTTYQLGIGIMNFLDTSGLGVGGSNNITHDCYLVDMAGTPLRLLRFNSSTGPATLQAASALALGDVVRASFDFTNSAQVTIVVKKNGVTQYTIVDNNALRLPSSGLSFPVIAAYSTAGAGNFLGLNFSAGVGL